MRCFIAMEMGDDVNNSIAAMVEDLRSAVHDGKPRVTWTRRDGWHVTLKFLGEVDADRVEPIAEALGSAVTRCASFSARAGGVATFPERGGKPRAIVVPIKDEGEAEQLAAVVDEAVRPLGFEPERRRYVAHLTVGRVRDNANWGPMAAMLRRYEEREFGEKRIESVALYESRLQPGGAQYTMLQRFPLATGA